MALTNNYVLITSAGLFEIGDSSIPKFNLAFSMPIYDYRIDSSILPQSGINSVIALSASVNYSDRYENIIGEKLAGNTALYSLSPEYNATAYPTSASISGTSAINLHQILPSSINLYNGLPIKNNNIDLGNIISGTSYPEIIVANNKSTFSYTSAPTLIETSAYTDPLSAIDTSTQTSALYPVTCYNPAYTSNNGITFIDGTFHFTIGKPNSGASFKYNKVAIFIQPSNQDDSPKENKLPVLFAYVVYSTPITISTQTPTMDTQVQLKFAGANPSLTLTVNSNDWAVVPSYMNEEGTNYLTGQYFYGDVAIGTSGIGQTWDPLAKLSLTDQTGRPQLALSNDYGHDKTTMHQYKNGVLHIQTSANVNNTTDGYSPNWLYSSQASAMPDKVGTYIFGNLESTKINPKTASSFIFSNRMYNTSASVGPNLALTPTISLRNSVVFGSLNTTSGDNNFLYVPYTSEAPEQNGGAVASVSGSNNVMFGGGSSSMALSGSNNFIHFSNISNSPGTLTTINDSILFGKGQTVTSAISYSNIVSLNYGGYFNNINNSNLLFTDGGNTIYNISASDIHALVGGNTISGCNLSKLNLAGGLENIKVVDRLNLTTLNSYGGTSILSAANSDLLFYSGPQVSAVCYSNIHDLASNTTYRGAYKSHALGYNNSLNTINSYYTSAFVPMSIRECNIYGNENSITVSTNVTANPSFTGEPTGAKVYTSTLIGWSNSIGSSSTSHNTSGNTIIGYNNTLTVYNQFNNTLGVQNALSVNYNSSIIGNYNIITSGQYVHNLGSNNTIQNSVGIHNVGSNLTIYSKDVKWLASISADDYKIVNISAYDTSAITDCVNIGINNTFYNTLVGYEAEAGVFPDTVTTLFNDIINVSNSYAFGYGNTISTPATMSIGYGIESNHTTTRGKVIIGKYNNPNALSTLLTSATTTNGSFDSAIEFGCGYNANSDQVSTAMRIGSYQTTNDTNKFGTYDFTKFYNSHSVIMFDDILASHNDGNTCTGPVSNSSIHRNGSISTGGHKCILFADLGDHTPNVGDSYTLKIRFIGGE